MRRLGEFVVCALSVAVLLALVLGMRPFVTHGVSMEPSIVGGTVLFTFPVAAAELVPGEVAVVSLPGGTTVAHRVVSVDPVLEGASLVLRGDNNFLDDAPLTVSSARRVFLSVPALPLLSSPSTWVLLVGALWVRRTLRRSWR